MAEYRRRILRRLLARRATARKAFRLLNKAVRRWRGRVEQVRVLRLGKIVRIRGFRDDESNEGVLGFLQRSDTRMSEALLDMEYDRRSMGDTLTLMMCDILDG